MKIHRCIGCNARAAGYIYNRRSLTICNWCRDTILSYLNHIGIPMTDEHPLINELCIDSAILEMDNWGFYDIINQRAGHVIQLSRKISRKRS